MSDLFVPTGDHDPDLALSAAGLLAAFNRAGVLTAADIHVTTTLGHLTAESDEHVLLAAALATRAVRHGSVCVDLAETVEGAPPEFPGPTGRNGPQRWAPPGWSPRGCCASRRPWST